MVFSLSSIDRNGYFDEKVIANNYLSFYEIEGVKIKEKLAQSKVSRRIYKILKSTEDKALIARMEEIILKYFELDSKEVNAKVIYTIDATKVPQEACLEVYRQFKVLKSKDKQDMPNEEEEVQDF